MRLANSTFQVVATSFLAILVGFTGCGDDKVTGSNGVAADANLAEGIDGGTTPDEGPAADGADSDTAPAVDVASCGAGQCTIDGECYGDGDSSASDPCQLCVVADSATDWSFVDGTVCDDETACTSDDVCSKGLCVGTALDCDDGNACTDNSCDPTKGCVGTNNTAACDDDSLCTSDDVCADGACGGTEVVCDDNNECTNDSCDDATGCAVKAIESGTCRPQIVVDFPARGATVLGELGTQTVTVTGSVVSPHGPITWFELNGEEVTVDADGAFSHPVTAAVGGNTLSFYAEDDVSKGRNRVQAFLWSSEYLRPTTPKVGMSEEGIGIFMSQEMLDDGDHSMPPDDLGTIFELVFASFDLNTLIPSPVASKVGGVPLSNATYTIFLNDISDAGAKVSLTAIDGGLHMAVYMAGPGGNGITGDILADKDCEWHWWDNPTCVGPGTVTGDLTIDYISIKTDILLSVDANHEIVVTPQDTVVVIGPAEVTDLSFDIFGLIEGVVNDLVGDMVKDLGDDFSGQIDDLLGPMLGEALGALAFNTSFALPKLDGSDGEIGIDLISDFQSIDFEDANPGPHGGTFTLRAGAFPSGGQVTPYDNLGVPGRVMCGGGGQGMALVNDYIIELGLADDLLNQILHAAWFGGLLDFPVPESLLAGADLEGSGITDLVMNISGMLAPTATDCNADGELIAHIGDLGVSATMKLLNLDVTLQVWASFTAGIALSADVDGIGIALTELKDMATEVTVLQDDLVALEPIIRDLIEEQLLGALLGSLGGGTLGSFPLPVIDLSESVGLAPGTAVIAIAPEDVLRVDGNTVVGGSLAGPPATP